MDTPTRRCKACGLDLPLERFRPHDHRCKRCWSIHYGHKPREIFPPGQKRCSKCKQIKPLSEFRPTYPKRKTRDGFRHQCKSCERANTRRYYAQNREEVKAKRRQYRKVNSALEYAREKDYFRRHPEKQIEKTRKYKAAHRKELVNAQRNREARKRASGGTHTIEDIRAQYKRQKGTCYYCGKKLGNKYHVDHVIPIARGGSNDPSNLVIACQHCNESKGAKLPHEWSKGGRLL